MKALGIVAIFVIGFIAGTQYKGQSIPKHSLSQNLESQEEQSPDYIEAMDRAAQKESVKTKSSDCDSKSVVNLGKFKRVPGKQVNRKMEKLQGQMYEALREEDLERQNEILRKMVELAPKHLTTYRTKERFMRMDGDYEGAHQVLKECVKEHPNDIHCHWGIANIRTSSKEEKKFHGEKCLELEPNNGLCLADMAFYYEGIGDFQKASEYLMKAIENQSASSGRHKKNFLYWHYGRNLENLEQFDEALAAYEEACRLKNSHACKKLEKHGDRTKS